MMKYALLILLAAFLYGAPPEVRAHNLVNVHGSAKDHQHVYRRQQYGKPLQQGHVLSNGRSSTVIWGSDMRPEYGKSTVRRSGPIIDDRKPGLGKTDKNGKRYGSAVNGYGKPVQAYGKPVKNYGKPAK